MIRIHLRSIDTSPTPDILAVLVVEADVAEAETVVLACIQSCEVGVALGGDGVELLFMR
jgi:hypothetical protein